MVFSIKSRGVGQYKIVQQNLEDKIKIKGCKHLKDWTYDYDRGTASPATIILMYANIWVYLGVAVVC